MNAVIDANAVVGGSQQCKGELVELDLLLKDPCTEGGKEEEKEVRTREKESSLGDSTALDQRSSPLWILRQAPILTPVLQLHA